MHGLGHEPSEWVAALLRGVCEVTEGDGVVGGFTTAAAPGGAVPVIDALFVHGVPMANLEAVEQMTERVCSTPEECVLWRRVVGRATRIAVLRWEELVDGDEWRGHPECEMLSALGVGDCLVAQLSSHQLSRTLGLQVWRRQDRGPFRSRHRRLLRLLQLEFSRRYIAPGPAGGRERAAVLSGRLREVLWLLCRGSGEKEIAMTLGLSRHTVHKYVTKLYRHFGVRSRGELLAAALRRPGPPSFEVLAECAPLGVRSSSNQCVGRR